MCWWWHKLIKSYYAVKIRTFGLQDGVPSAAFCHSSFAVINLSFPLHSFCSPSVLFPPASQPLQGCLALLSNCSQLPSLGLLSPKSPKSPHRGHLTLHLPSKPSPAYSMITDFIIEISSPKLDGSPLGLL